MVGTVLQGHREKRSLRTWRTRKPLENTSAAGARSWASPRGSSPSALFVTESAVSKWERGLSYPDVTLLRSICEILEISEHELLTASEDTEGRRAELLARKYLALTRNFRLAQYIFYGLILLVCLIVNLSVDHCLSWFFLALAIVGACASLTLLPAPGGGAPGRLGRRGASRCGWSCP